VLVRTWNVFHGNASPPERKAFLADMVELAVRDRPAIVLLQELPVWSVQKLEEWSGMRAVGDIAARPLLGSNPLSLRVEHALTDLHHGLLRSAFTGEAIAILVAPELRVVDHRVLVLNPFAFRRRVARRLGLGLLAVAAWGKNRRVCQALRVTRGSETFVVANLHATTNANKRLADAELLRAATFVDGFARPGEPVLFGGDFNLSLRNSHVLRQLTNDEWGFEGPTETGIDHVLARRMQAGPPRRRALERRRLGGRVLSDHAPVDREVA
jgi:endonuclease/exonuclease/phosphatase family metal-dependent hydrolase